VYEALAARRTVREISPKELTPELLSGLLWAANGVNRTKGPFGANGRTAASASNSREIDIYAAFADGVYLYEPEQHRLVPVAEGDLRRLAIGARQNMGNHAPVRLIYVADTAKFAKAGFQEPGLHDPETMKSYYYADTGLAAGNVYLYAASRGLAAWFHNCDRAALPKALNLRPEQLPLFGQTVGFPENK
jgi:nitroreductase